jgi:preprotein translocase SecE subunit
MTDKKKNASRSQMAESRARGSDKEQPTRSVKTTAREDRKEQPAKNVKAATRSEQPKQEAKPVRRDTKGSSSWMLRFRNNRIGRFIMEAYYELRHKVTWPTFPEARNMTIAVILLSAAVGGILSLADYGLYQLFLLISSNAR